MLKGEKIDLKPIDMNDIEWLRKIRNQYRDSFYSRDEITPQQQRSWYIRYQEESTDQMFIIKDKNGEQIGTIALYNMNMSDRSAEIGRIVLLEDYRSQGYMEEALRLVVNYGFNRLRLYRLKVSTYLDNAAAIGLYNKVGFESLSRPVMLMEMRNSDTGVWDKPLRLETTD